MTYVKQDAFLKQEIEKIVKEYLDIKALSQTSWNGLTISLLTLFESMIPEENTDAEPIEFASHPREHSARGFNLCREQILAKIRGESMKQITENKCLDCGSVLIPTINPEGKGFLICSKCGNRSHIVRK